MRLIVLKREFNFTLLGLIGYVVILALLCSLGFWQLDRAEQKKHFLQQQQAALNAEARNLNLEPLVDLEADRYQNVQATGRFDTEHQFLLDNQIVDGKAGYFVFTPFLIDQQPRAVLVNRGWLPLNKDRKLIPDISIKAAVKQITGRINHFPSVGLKLKGAETPTIGWPALVQVVDSQVLGKVLDYDLYDFQIELDAGAVEGYSRQWKISSSMPPEKHVAYAVQWFSLALTLTGLFIWISRRKQSEHTT